MSTDSNVQITPAVSGQAGAASVVVTPQPALTKEAVEARIVNLETIRDGKLTVIDQETVAAKEAVEARIREMRTAEYAKINKKRATDKEAARRTCKAAVVQWQKVLKAMSLEGPSADAETTQEVAGVNDAAAIQAADVEPPAKEPAKPAAEVQPIAPEAQAVPVRTPQPGYEQAESGK